MITKALEDGLADKFCENAQPIMGDLTRFALKMKRKGVDMRVTLDTHEQKITVIARIAPNAPSSMNPVVVCFDGGDGAFLEAKKIRLRIETELNTWGKANVK